MGTPRTSTRKLKAKRPRSNLGQPQVKVSLLLIIPVHACLVNSDKLDHSHEEPCRSWLRSSGADAESLMQDEPGLKSKDSGLSSMDGESNSDNEDHSHEEPGGAPGKKRMRKIPKLPMVRHGKKWYRARLLKDSGQRVQIGERTCPPQTHVPAYLSVSLPPPIDVLVTESC